MHAKDAANLLVNVWSEPQIDELVPLQSRAFSCLLDGHTLAYTSAAGEHRNRVHDELLIFIHHLHLCKDQPNANAQSQSENDWGTVCRAASATFKACSKCSAVRTRIWRQVWTSLPLPGRLPGCQERTWPTCSMKAWSNGKRSKQWIFLNRNVYLIKTSIMCFGIMPTVEM